MEKLRRSFVTDFPGFRHILGDFRSWQQVVNLRMILKTYKLCAVRARALVNPRLCRECPVNMRPPSTAAAAAAAAVAAAAAT